MRLHLTDWIAGYDQPQAKLKVLYWQYPHYYRTNPYGGTWHGDIKLIEFFGTGELELYNLKEDPNYDPAAEKEMNKQRRKKM